MDLYDVTHRAIWKTLDGVSADRLRRPNADGWSILHVLEHILLIEQRTTEAIAAALASPPASGVDPDKDLSFALVRTTKLRAPEVMSPKGIFGSLGEAQAALAASQAELTRTYASAGPGDVDTHGHVHGAFGMLSARQWHDIAALHGLRHLGQIHDMVRGG